MKIVDTHCHPQFPQYDADRDAVIQRAIKAGVGIICVGTDLEMSKKALVLAEQYEGVWASVGLHPNDNLEENYDQGKYSELAVHSKVVAIGEVGLDYYRTTDEERKKIQKKRFEEQIQLSIEVKKPLIMHCRDAHRDMLEALQYYRDKLIGGVIHSFTGTHEDAKHYLEMDLFLGFNGIITFARDYDGTVTNVPVDNILLETDAPYLAPVPHRGKRNEPGFILEIAGKVAELKGLDIDSFIEKIRQNTKRLFTI
jgi:TatD DNase family protein